MTGIVGQRVSLGQARGGDVELVVTGTALYGTYETPQGYPVIYDDDAGLFCFARVIDGEYRSTGVPVTAAVPDGVEKHAKESEQVRAAKIAKRQAAMERRSRGSE